MPEDQSADRSAEPLLLDSTLDAVRASLVRLVRENGGSVDAIDMAHHIGDAFTASAISEANLILDPFATELAARTLLQVYVVTTDKRLDAISWPIFQLSKAFARREMAVYDELRAIVGKL